MNVTETITTAVANGEVGGTYATTDTDVPTSGYFVGGEVDSLVNPTTDEISDFVAANRSEYVGFWYDTADSALYVDAVTHTASERYARRLSALRNEIAFWDITNNQEVRV